MFVVEVYELTEMGGELLEISSKFYFANTCLSINEQNYLFNILTMLRNRATTLLQLHYCTRARMYKNRNYFYISQRRNKEFFL